MHQKQMLLAYEKDEVINLLKPMKTPLWDGFFGFNLSSSLLNLRLLML